MGEVTQLLSAARDGDASSGERLFSLIYAELERLARSQLRRDRTLTLLDAPSLVHEAFLRLTQQAELPGRNRRMFLAYASAVMRTVVVDYVRSRAAAKRGGDRPLLTLTTSVAGVAFEEPEIESLDRALRALQRVDGRAHRVVEMRYFGGLGIEEIADVLEVAPATVKRDWQRARAFLHAQLRPERPGA